MPTDSSSSGSKKSEGVQGKEAISNLSWNLSQMKKQIQSSRLVSIRDKIEKNKINLQAHTRRIFDSAVASSSRGSLPESEIMLSVRMREPFCKLSGWESSNGFVEKESVHTQEEIPSSSALVFDSNGGKTAVCLIKLPHIEKISPYTTWIFLDRNQRMAEDQSVVGRRRIYYDPYGNETLICSDSDEEIAEPEEEKHDFSEGEDQILWKALQDHGKTQEVLNVLTQFIEATSSEIEDRYGTLMGKHQEELMRNSEASDEVQSEERLFLDKTLTAALDSFDNLFCRRCLIFDCRLHGCSQSLVIPTEKQSHAFDLEETKNPCGDQCYLRRRDDDFLCQDISNSSITRKRSSMPKEKMVTDQTIKVPNNGTTSAEASAITRGKRKSLKPEIIPPDACLLGEDLVDINPTLADDTSKISGAHNDHQIERELINEPFLPSITDTSSGSNINPLEDIENNTIKLPMIKNSSVSTKGRIQHGWNTFEKDLYLKGIEIFGRNSCLIARNLLSGLKTCMEVSSYMINDGVTLASRSMSTNSFLEDGEKADHDCMDQEMAPRTRIWRRRGRARKLKYTWKSTGHPSIRKRIGDEKQQSCKQYTPCGCHLMCGKDCPCMNNGTCCEKYCGCSKSCKNRFRGCHCAKSQCRSRQCPCFAAGRECDPDVCRNCWVSCGDDSLGEPPSRGDGYQCGNMKLLLKQRQRILLGRSDVAGWGAFIKNPVNKNDYLGEYTGELISQKEADKRGKIYDRANSSFLFDLNDQYVLDAYRKGDKLKFANHSSNPNCYAKVMLVAGDHRVGIFAKEHIEASEELFYDYRYGPDQAPAWARKPGGSKRDDSSVSHNRAQKIA